MSERKNRALPALCAAGLLLAALTAGMMVPYDWPGVFDARTAERAPGFSLSLAPEALVFEPLFGPARAFVLSPDVRAAAFSWPLWGLGIGLLIAAVHEIRRRRSGSSAFRLAPLLKRAALPPLLAVFFLLACGMFPHAPGYRLTPPGPEYVSVNFHGHTYRSDGFFSPAYTVKWHRANGFDAAALVDPLTLEGAREAAAFAAENPPMTVIAGEESRYNFAGYFIALGLEQPIDLDPIDNLDEFCPEFHEKGAALISCMAIPHRNRSRAETLAEKGFDAFEIYNHGHQPLWREGEEWRSSPGARGLPALASVDWHGKSMGAKTWTAVRLPGWREEPDHDKRAAAVVRALRERRTPDFLPLTAGSPLPATTLRLIFDPFATLGEYLLGLTFPQWISWLAWITAGLALAAAWPRIASAPFRGRELVAGFLLACSFLLAIQGPLLLLNFILFAPDATMIVATGALFVTAGAAAAATAAFLCASPR